MRNVSRFWLRAHCLKVESCKGLGGSNIYDKCWCAEVQDEKHVNASLNQATWVPNRRYGGVYGGHQGPSKTHVMFERDYRGYLTAEELQARQCN
eukprot:729120-Pelagomonas_calceolata.AAC.1